MLNDRKLAEQTFHQSNAYENFVIAARDYANILIKEKGGSPTYVVQQMKDIVNDTIMDEITKE
jgi:hypothetical protein